MKSTIPVSRLVDFASGKLSPEDGLKVLDQIEDNAGASKMLEKTIELLALSSESNLKTGEGKVVPSQNGFRGVREKAIHVYRWVGQSRPRLAILGIGIAVTIVAVIVSPLPTLSKIAALTIPTDDEVHMITRGAERGEVDLAAHLMAGQRFDDAARVLDWYIAAFPNSDDLGRAHFLSGLTHLRMAQKTFLGVFIGIDRESVRRANAHLLSAWMLSKTTERSEETVWYLARGQVLLQDEGNAAQYLELVEKGNGPHAQAAKQLESLVSGQ